MLKDQTGSIMPAPTPPQRHPSHATAVGWQPVTHVMPIDGEKETGSNFAANKCYTTFSSPPNLNDSHFSWVSILSLSKSSFFRNVQKISVRGSSGLCSCTDWFRVKKKKKERKPLRAQTAPSSRCRQFASVTWIESSGGHSSYSHSEHIFNIFVHAGL